MKDIILLHGALGSAVQLEPLADLLRNDFRVHSLNFSGHGGKESNGRFDVADFVLDVIQYMEKHAIVNADIFGYSMGGFVALVLAKDQPGFAGRIFTLATKFDWNPENAAQEATMLNPSLMEQKIPKYAAELQQRHAPADWKTVVAETAAMMIGLGSNNPLDKNALQAIQNQVTIAVGDRDKMIAVEESLDTYRSLPNSRLVVLPDTNHPLEMVDPDRLASEIRMFFK